MGNFVGALLGVMFIITIVVMAITAIVAAIIAIAVMVLTAIAIMAPPAAAGFILRHLFKRYRLSRSKKQQCAIVVIALFLAPLSILFADPNAFWPALWSAITLSMCGLVLFLVIEAFRQHFRELRLASARHRLGSLNGSLALSATRFQSWRNTARLNSLQRRFGKILEERQRMETLVSGLVSEGDVRFLSSERYRLNRTLCKTSKETIENQLQQTLAELNGLPELNPRQQTLALHAGIMRQSLCDQQISRENWHAWCKETGRKVQIQKTINELNEKIQAHRNASRDARLSIKQRKRQILNLF